MPVVRVGFELNLNFRDRFSKKSSNIKVIRSRLVEAEFSRADGQRDMAKLTVAFRNFANAPTNFTFCPQIYVVFCMDFGTNGDYFPIQH